MRRMSETTDVKVISDEIDPNLESELSSGNLEHLTIPEGVEVYEIKVHTSLEPAIALRKSWHPSATVLK